MRIIIEFDEGPPRRRVAPDDEDTEAPPAVDAGGPPAALLGDTALLGVRLPLPDGGAGGPQAGDGDGGAAPEG